MPPRSRYRWNEKLARYQDPRGRTVSRAAVRAELDRVIDRNARAMQTLGRQLRERRISVARFELQMRERIKHLHLASAAAAKGGWGHMSPADNGRAGRLIREQYRFLRGLARDVASGKQARDGRLLVRVKMYGDAARQTYHAIDRREQEEHGMTEERSIKHALDSCDECIAARDAGWQPVGTLPLPGDRTCLTNCKCEMEYRAA